MTTTRVAGTLVFSAVLLGAPSLARCQGNGMAGMSGMDMGHEIVIPDGALFTKDDVSWSRWVLTGGGFGLLSKDGTPTAEAEQIKSAIQPSP